MDLSMLAAYGIAVAAPVLLVVAVVNLPWSTRDILLTRDAVTQASCTVWHAAVAVWRKRGDL